MTSTNRHWGSAHGRFQPFHLGHLEYLLAAKSHCAFLWVGITQFDVTCLLESPADRHRQSRFNNPLTYFERSEMITDSLVDSGLTKDQFAILPFPIDRPESLPNFLPTSVPVFSTVCEPWGRHKIELLQQVGYEVIVLWERDIKLHEGMKIRRQIMVGDATWRAAVPPATARLVENWRIHERLEALERSEYAEGQA